MDICQECDLGLGVADTGMLKRWIETTASNPGMWTGRLGGRTTLVCPRCDCYALGVEMALGLPFYSSTVAAFLTVNDWDWWNADPSDCDIRQWPDFGCLTFSEESLRSMVNELRATAPDLLAASSEMPFAADLIASTGIPEDEDPEAEWENQLNILQPRMQGEFSKREIDVAVRHLVQIIA